jgi:monothiol glutaredoxin
VKARAIQRAAATVEALKPYGELFTVDVLAEPEVREGIKEYSSWPTIPQVFINGKFVGGCDIVREMFETGELQQLMKDKGVTLATAA